MKLSYETEAISVEIRSQVEEYDYMDANKREKTRFERQMKVLVRFWDFKCQSNLQDLAIIKGVLLYYTHGYWKRSGKEIYKLNINQELCQDNYSFPGNLAEKLVLRFADRQKNKMNSLHISLHKNEKLVAEMYLDIQEAIILEVAVNKAMQLLSPTTDLKGWDFS